MARRIGGPAKSLLLAVSALTCGLLLAGCEDHITVISDSYIRIPKGATWAWRPIAASSEFENRPVISRDIITRDQAVARQADPNREIVRQRFQTAVEQTLSSKGMREVKDPQDAEFLVDYHVAVRRREATVQQVYPGGYPGMVCGPFGCWESWGWGPPEISYEHIRFREGTVVVDVVQQSSKQLAYRAIGQKPVHRDTFSQDEITEFIHHMLGKLKTHG